MSKVRPTGESNRSTHKAVNAKTKNPGLAKLEGRISKLRAIPTNLTYKKGAIKVGALKEYKFTLQKSKAIGTPTKLMKGLTKSR